MSVGARSNCSVSTAQDSDQAHPACDIRTIIDELSSSDSADSDDDDDKTTPKLLDEIFGGLERFNECTVPRAACFNTQSSGGCEPHAYASRNEHVLTNQLGFIDAVLEHIQRAFEDRCVSPPSLAHEDASDTSVAETSPRRPPLEKSVSFTASTTKRRHSRAGDDGKKTSHERTTPPQRLKSAGTIRFHDNKAPQDSATEKRVEIDSGVPDFTADTRPAVVRGRPKRLVRGTSATTVGSVSPTSTVNVHRRASSTLLRSISSRKELLDRFSSGQRKSSSSKLASGGENKRRTSTNSNKLKRGKSGATVYSTDESDDVDDADPPDINTIFVDTLLPMLYDELTPEYALAERLKEVTSPPTEKLKWSSMHAMSPLARLRLHVFPLLLAAMDDACKFIQLRNIVYNKHDRARFQPLWYIANFLYEHNPQHPERRLRNNIKQRRWTLSPGNQATLQNSRLNELPLFLRMSRTRAASVIQAAWRGLVARRRASPRVQNFRTRLRARRERGKSLDKLFDRFWSARLNVHWRDATANVDTGHIKPPVSSRGRRAVTDRPGLRKREPSLIEKSFGREQLALSLPAYLARRIVEAEEADKLHTVQMNSIQAERLMLAPVKSRVAQMQEFSEKFKKRRNDSQMQVTAATTVAGLLLTVPARRHHQMGKRVFWRENSKPFV